MSVPVITAVMPVRDRADLLEASMRSVLAQTERDWELIVFDDGSVDDSRAVAARVAAGDARVRVMGRDTSRGIPVTRNELLRAARGRYLAICDSDDISRPERFERQRAALDSDATLVGVGARFTVFDGDDPAAGVEPGWHHGLRDGRLPFGTPTAMFRTSAVRDVGGYTETYPLAEDLRLSYALSQRYGSERGFCELDDVLVDVRAHAGSISRTPAQLRAREWHNLRAQLYGLRALRGRFSVRGYLVIAQSMLRVLRAGIAR